ncbi:MAG TPA: hypothetical protein VIO16_11645 [Dehalococcoidia bacterium]
MCSNDRYALSVTLESPRAALLFSVAGYHQANQPARRPVLGVGIEVETRGDAGARFRLAECPDPFTRGKIGKDASSTAIADRCGASNPVTSASDTQRNMGVRQAMVT